MVYSQNLLTSVVERTPKIEKVNVDGGRFIREAKVTIGRQREIVERQWRFTELRDAILILWQLQNGVHFGRHLVYRSGFQNGGSQDCRSEFLIWKALAIKSWWWEIVILSLILLCRMSLPLRQLTSQHYLKNLQSPSSPSKLWKVV